VVSTCQKLIILDIQGLETRYSYESSKRLVDLVCLAYQKDKSSKTVPMYSTSPGCTASNILDGYLPIWIHWCLLLIIRTVFGIRQVNLGDNCVAAMMFLINVVSKEGGIDMGVKYCSESSRFGDSIVTFEKIQESEVGEADKAYRCCLVKMREGMRS
jgi:hypothetical protein